VSLREYSVLLDPRTRFVSFLFCLVLFLVTDFSGGGLWKFAAFFLMLAAVFFLTYERRRGSFRRFVRLSLYLFSLLLFLGLVLLVFSPLSGRARLAGFVDLAAKTILVFAAAYVFIIGHDFGPLIKAFYLWRWPQVIINILTFGYRYFLIFEEELVSLFRARKARRIGRRPFFAELKTTGSLLESFFLRTVDRSEKIYAALISRGYEGRLDFLTDFRLAGRDFVFFVALAVLFLAVRVS